MNKVASHFTMLAVAIGMIVPAQSQAVYFAPPPPPVFASATRVNVNVAVPRSYGFSPYAGGSHGMPGYGFGGGCGYGGCGGYGRGYGNGYGDYWGRRYANYGGCYSRWGWCARHRRHRKHRKHRSFSLSLGIGFGGFSFGLNLRSVRF